MSESCHHNDDDHTEGSACTGKHANDSPLLVELREHVPFSVLAVAIGLIVAGAICILGGGSDSALLHESDPHLCATHGHSPEDHHDHPADQPTAENIQSEPHDHDHGSDFSRLFFHLFHPVHMLFSAAATAAMFSRYERRAFKAIVVGLIGAIGVCGISDVIMPHVSLTLLGVQAPWHLCVWEDPGLVLPFAVVGVLIGVATAGSTKQSTIVSHSLHVLASTMASIFYMVGPLGVVAWIHDLGQVFIFVVLAVMIPCCLSDVVFPLLMSSAAKEAHSREPHVH